MNDDDPRELTPEELAAEDLTELPDREAMSLIRPDGGFHTMPGVLPIQPQPIDPPQPVPMDVAPPPESA